MILPGHEIDHEDELLDLSDEEYDRYLDWLRAGFSKKVAMESVTDPDLPRFDPARLYT